MCPPPIPQMSKNEATESQRQSEAIRGHQRPSVACHTEANRDHQMQSGRTSDEIRRNQTQSDAIRRNHVAIRRNQTQSACPEHCVSVFSCFGRAARACVLCFCVLSRHNGPVFCVFVFWQTPLKTQHGAKSTRPSDSVRILCHAARRPLFRRVGVHGEIDATVGASVASAGRAPQVCGWPRWLQALAACAAAHAATASCRA